MTDDLLRLAIPRDPRSSCRSKLPRRGWQRSRARPTGPGRPRRDPDRCTASGPPSDAGSSPSGRRSRRPRLDRSAARADRRQPLTPASSTGTPPLRTAVGRRRTSMSSSGSASTATRSAKRPGASEPTRSSQPISSAAVRVAERIASSRGLAEADLVAELDRDHPVRVDAAVGAVGDPHAGRHGLRERVALGLRSSRRSWPSSRPASRPGAPPRRSSRRRRRRRPGTCRVDEHRDPLVVDERAVLDRADAGPDRDLDALGAVGVRGDVRAVRRRLLDGGPDHRLGQLDRARRRCRGSGPRR